MTEQSVQATLEIPWREVAAGLGVLPDVLEKAVMAEQVEIEQEVIEKNQPDDPQQIRLFFRYLGREATVVVTLQMPQEP
ncbi:MAG: hypothetical protein HQL53_13545 [Magnetococcales bacterium]|nr:hypothetical protein [Magnetococcales bacterium]